MYIAPENLAIHRYLFACFYQDEIAYMEFGILDREDEFLVLIVESDHVGHHFLLFGQFVQFFLCPVYRFMFYPFTQENKGDDGGRCFIKDIIHAHMAEGTDQAVHEGGQGADGDQYIHIGYAAAQAFKGAYAKISHAYEEYRDADRQLDPGIHQEMDMPGQHVQHQYQGERQAKEESLQVVGEEVPDVECSMLYRVADRFRHHFIAEVGDAFGEFFLRPGSVGFKTHIAADKVYIYLLQPLFAEIAGNGKRTIGAIHTFYLPFNFFHTAKLFQRIVARLLLQENIFATWR